MAARFDEAGQMAALGGFASKMGLAFGPMMAGYVLSTEGGYPLLIGISVAMILMCVATAFFPAGDLDRRA
jgi:cyanate permease